VQYTFWRQQFSPSASLSNLPQSSSSPLTWQDTKPSRALSRTKIAAAQNMSVLSHTLTLNKLPPRMEPEVAVEAAKEKSS